MASISGCTSHIGLNLNSFPKLSTAQFGHSTTGRPKTVSMSRSSTATATTNAFTKPSLYETLGISEKGTILEIKSAYKKMARKFHPDVAREAERVDEYTRRFIQIQEAYETLSDPKARAVYDSREMDRRVHLDWSKKWQSQLDGLLRKSMARGRGNNTMRRWQRNDEHVMA